MVWINYRSIFSVMNTNTTNLRCCCSALALLTGKVENFYFSALRSCWRWNSCSSFSGNFSTFIRFLSLFSYSVFFPSPLSVNLIPYRFFLRSSSVRSLNKHSVSCCWTKKLWTSSLWTCDRLLLSCVDTSPCCHLSPHQSSLFLSVTFVVSFDSDFDSSPWVQRLDSCGRVFHNRSYTGVRGQPLQLLKHRWC